MLKEAFTEVVQHFKPIKDVLRSIELIMNVGVPSQQGLIREFIDRLDMLLHVTLSS